MTAFQAREIIRLRDVSTTEKRTEFKQALAVMAGLAFIVP